MYSIQNSRIVEIIEWPWNFSEHQIPNFIAWTMKQWEQKQEISFVQPVQKLAQNHNGIANNKNKQKKMEKSEEQSQNQDEIVSHESNSKIVLSTQFLFAIEAFLPAIEAFSSRNRRKFIFFLARIKKMMLFSKVNRSLKVQ